jgi:Dolichyl-phosphate-mannose-protein mannosyltransferase
VEGPSSAEPTEPAPRASQLALEWIRRTTAGNRPWIVLAWLGLAVSFAFVALFGMDAGVSYDENAQRNYGDLILRWFRSGFTDEGAMHYRDLYLYGGLFDAPVQWLAQFSPYGMYETRHLFSALVAVLGLVATWKVASAITGPRAGFLGAAILALTPLWIGHGLMNPKDIPFATAAMFASLSSVRLAMGPAPLRISEMCWAGVTVGIALGVRPGGNFVIGYPCLAAGLRIALEVWRRHRDGSPLELTRLTLNLALCGVLVLTIGWAIMLLFWPWAQLDPFERPLIAMWKARHFKWPSTVLFDGSYVKSTDLPLSYLPVWFKVTLPETYLLGAIALLGLGVALIVRRPWLRGQRVLGWAMLVTFVVLPFAAVLITRPVLYDAQRHVLFLLPPMSALAGCALSGVFGAEYLPRAVRGGVAGVLAGLALLVAIDIAQLHPFEYVYFNRASGGLAKQFRRFETDYWSIGYRQGFEWVLNELLPQQSGRRIRIIACDRAGNERLEYYLSQRPDASSKLSVVRNYEQADVLIAVRRWNCHRKAGTTLGTIQRQRAPLVYIRRIKHDSG